MLGSNLTPGRDCLARQVEIFQSGDARHAILMEFCLQCFVLFVCLSELQAITAVRVDRGVNSTDWPEWLLSGIVENRSVKERSRKGWAVFQEVLICFSVVSVSKHTYIYTTTNMKRCDLYCSKNCKKNPIVSCSVNTSTGYQYVLFNKAGVRGWRKPPWSLSANSCGRKDQHSAKDRSAKDENTPLHLDTWGWCGHLTQRIPETFPFESHFFSYGSLLLTYQTVKATAECTACYGNDGKRFFNGWSCDHVSSQWKGSNQDRH